MARQPETCFEIGAKQLESLSQICLSKGKALQAQQLFENLAKLAGDAPVDAPPRWSGMTADCTPFEFSLSLHKIGYQLRFLLEAQDDPASARSYWHAGLKINEFLNEKRLVDLTRFDKIRELFEPTDEDAFWAMWHAFDLRNEGVPLCKIYLNALAQGRDNGAARVSEAMGRLGLQASFEFLERAMIPSDIFTHFSLDLTNAEHARIKVYVRHYGLSFKRLGKLFELARGNVAKDAIEFSERMTGHDSSFVDRPVFTVYHYSGPRPVSPERVVLNIPSFPYSKNDFIANKRMREYLDKHDIPSKAYEQCLRTMSNIPLEQSEGVHCYWSFTSMNQSPRVTIYFGSRLFYDSYGNLSHDPKQFWPSPIATEFPDIT